jgi:putative lipoprotein (rSAM/lipoprotein system)
MKKIRHSFLKGFNAVLMAVLTLFGFSNCDRGGLDMYGTPSADFIIKGAVVDKTTNQPIEGIQVKIVEVFVDNQNNEHIRYQTKSTTDAGGNFEIIERGYMMGFSLSARISDIDGAENGLFEDKVIELDMRNAERTRPGRGWFSGEFTKNLDVQLTPKEEEKEDENIN